MKTYLLPIALASLAIGAMAGAQTPPSSSSPPSSSATAPSSTTQSPSSSSYSNGSDSKQAMKDCVAKQKAANPSISEADAKTACKDK